MEGRKEENMNAFKKLHAHFKTHDAIAETFKLTRQGVSYWKKIGIPTKRAKEVEKKTKGAVTAMEVLGG